MDTESAQPFAWWGKKHLETLGSCASKDQKELITEKGQAGKRAT